MCTVTYLPAEGRYFLTSNRDEKHFRSDALPPEIHVMKSGRILYPRDRDANGTWVALHETGHAVIFLNGGFIKHEPAPPYRKSRGLILLEITDSPSPLSQFQQMDLDNIEPFTAIIFDKGELTECRWDGSRKYSEEKDSATPHIWSSVTLYNPEIISKRNQWFDEWRKKHPHADADDILHFHEFTGDGDSANNLKMNRNGFVFTVSITSITLEDRRGVMQYFDLKNNRRHEQELIFHQPLPAF